MTHPHREPEPEFFHEDDRLREFVEMVHTTADEHEEIPTLLDALEDPFEELLLEDGWLPERYQDLSPAEMEDKGKMGDDIAQWLLYRFGNKLALFTLVLPPGASTPVPDHLAWGLVGIYGGTQREEFYRRIDDGGHEGDAELEHLRTEDVARGDYYRLEPPNNDIHSVETTSNEPSVSVHLLGADVGCIERHAFDVGAERVERFQSGYTNVECDVVLEPPAVDDGDGGPHDHDHDELRL
jgi:3-mercaptopropionate dioxygenase